MATRRTPVRRPRRVVRPLPARTAWHPILVVLFRQLLEALGFHVQPESPLASEPLRVDIVIRGSLKRGATLPRLLRCLWERLAEHTLVHYKGPSSELEPDDALAIVGYLVQYGRLVPEAREQGMVLWVMASRLTPRFVTELQLLGGSLQPEPNEPGLWQGQVVGFPLVAIEMAVRADRAGEHLLGALSLPILEHPGHVTESLDPEEAKLFGILYRSMERFRTRGDLTMALDAKQIDDSFRKVFRDLLGDPDILRSLQPLPDAMIAHLSALIPPEQLLAGLDAEQRLAGLNAEQRLAGLDAAHTVLALPVEVLRALNPEYLATLPQDVQDEVRRRLERA